MAYTVVALKNKIREMYPDIQKHHITFGLDYSEEKSAYVAHFKKDSHELITYIEKDDANECMDDVKCVHLGIKFGDFIKNFEA